MMRRAACVAALLAVNVVAFGGRAAARDVVPLASLAAAASGVEFRSGYVMDRGDGITTCVTFTVPDQRMIASIRLAFQLYGSDGASITPQIATISDGLEFAPAKYRPPSGLYTKCLFTAKLNLTVDASKGGVVSVAAVSYRDKSGWTAPAGIDLQTPRVVLPALNPVPSPTASAGS